MIIILINEECLLLGVDRYYLFTADLAHEISNNEKNNLLAILKITTAQHDNTVIIFKKGF